MTTWAFAASGSTAFRTTSILMELRGKGGGSRSSVATGVPLRDRDEGEHVHRGTRFASSRPHADEPGSVRVRGGGESRGRGLQPPFVGPEDAPHVDLGGRHERERERGSEGAGEQR